MLQILDYKIEMEKTQPSMKTEEVAASYNAHMKELDSNIEETISANFVAAAIRVFNKMLRSPRIMELLVAEENERGRRPSSTTPASWMLSRRPPRTRSPATGS